MKCPSCKGVGRVSFRNCPRSISCADCDGTGEVNNEEYDAEQDARIRRILERKSEHERGLR